MKKRKFTTLTVKQGNETYKKSVAYRTLAELAEKKEAFEQECKRKENPLFEDIADQWKEEHDAVIEYYTIKYYEAALNDLKAEFKNTPISEIQPLDVQAVLDKMQRQGYAKSTITGRKITASLIFDYAVLHGLLQFNPAKATRVPKAPRQPRTPPSEADLARIAAAPDSFWKRYYLFLMYTGLRKEEALALTKADLDFENCTVNVNKVIIFQGTTPTLREYAKTKAGNRLAPFPKILHPYFENAKNGVIFGQNGKHLTSGQFGAWSAKWKKENGITCTSHQLRHFFATMCHGVIDAKDAQHLLGHANIQTTLDIYTTIDAQQRAAAIEKLNQYLKHNENTQSEKTALSLQS